MAYNRLANCVLRTAGTRDFARYNKATTWQSEPTLVLMTLATPNEILERTPYAQQLEGMTPQNKFSFTLPTTQGHISSILSSLRQAKSHLTCSDTTADTTQSSQARNDNAVPDIVDGNAAPDIEIEAYKLGTAAAIGDPCAAEQSAVSPRQIDVARAYAIPDRRQLLGAELPQTTQRSKHQVGLCGRIPRPSPSV